MHLPLLERHFDNCRYRSHWNLTDLFGWATAGGTRRLCEEREHWPPGTPRARRRRQCLAVWAAPSPLAGRARTASAAATPRGSRPPRRGTRTVPPSPAWLSAGAACPLLPAVGQKGAARDLLTRKTGVTRELLTWKTRETRDLLTWKTRVTRDLLTRKTGVTRELLPVKRG